MNAPMPAPPRGPRLDPVKLWSGGAATAVVAALVAVVGILVARGVLDIPVLAPQGDGAWGNASTWGYAVAAAVGALVATGLLHMLAATTPRYSTFFVWIMLLLTAIAFVLPLTLDTKMTSSAVATAVINLVIGLTITIILPGVARSARVRPVQNYQPPMPGAQQGWPPERA
jgi:hypothetical protein